MCSHAKERDAAKSPPEPRIFTAKGDAISPLRSKFPFFGQPFEYLYGPNFMLDLRLTEDESKTGKGGIDLLRMIGGGGS